MRKRDELADPNSCLNKAKQDEWIFVLLGRDEEAPETVRYWVGRRIMKGKNKPGDPKMVEALQWADRIENQLAGAAEEVANG